MNVFLTGGSGYVGHAVGEALLRRGHRVHALVRAKPTAARVVNPLPAGAVAVAGDLRDPGTYRDAVLQSDVVIHAAFSYDGDDAQGSQIDAAAARAMLSLLKTRRGALIYTSSVYDFRTRGADAVDESAATAPFEALTDPWRFALERELLAAAEVRVAIIRLGMVYGGLGGTLPDLFALAAKGHRVVYPGDGRARASLIHRADLAELYARVAEGNSEARGIFHAVDGAPRTARAIAAAVAAAGGLGAAQVESIDPSQPHPALRDHTLDVLQRDVAVIATRSRALGWQPRFARFEDGVAFALAEYQNERGALSPDGARAAPEPT